MSSRVERLLSPAQSEKAAVQAELGRRPDELCDSDLLDSMILAALTAAAERPDLLGWLRPAPQSILS